MDSNALSFRKTVVSDGKILKQWLMDEQVLDGFPMEEEKEVIEAVDYWMQFCAIGASITAMLGEKLAGIANLYIRNIKKFRHQCLLVIVVDPELRGQGIGKALLEQLQELAKKTFNIETLFLEIYKGNRAINLYRRLGFKEIGEQKSFLIDSKGRHFDKIMMEKAL